MGPTARHTDALTGIGPRRDAEPGPDAGAVPGVGR